MLSNLSIVKILRYAAIIMLIIPIFIQLIGFLNVIVGYSYPHEKEELLQNIVLMLVSGFANIIWQPLMLLGLARVIELQEEKKND